MANMSYCRFENTYRALLDCNEHIGDEDLSRTEFAYREQLVDLCKDIVSTVETFEEKEKEDL